MTADCTCPCNMVHVQKNYTSSELSKIIEKMKKELIVNKEQLSSTLRKKISVMDNRPSSRSIGSFGVVIIVFVFSLLLAADVMILKNHISMLVRTLVDFAKRFARNWNGMVHLISNTDISPSTIKILNSYFNQRCESVRHVDTYVIWIFKVNAV